MHNPRKLRRLIAGAVLGSVLAVEGALFVPSYHNFRAEQVRVLRERLACVVQMGADRLESGDSAEAVARALMIEATGVRLVSPGGAVLAERGVFPEGWPVGLEYRNDTLVSDFPLGDSGLTARVHVAHLEVENALLAFAGRIGLMALLIAAAVTATTLWIFSRNVLRPLERLTRSVEDGEITPERLGAMTYRPDEIGVLAMSFLEFSRLERRRVLAEAERDAAMASARLKSEFVANMSHEIRTPIHGVIGMTTLLLETDLDHVQSEYAETVRRSSNTLLALVNDILDFSKIEANHLEFEEIDFEPRGVVEEIGQLLAERAHAKRVELITAVDEDVPRVLRGDPNRIGQVLTNLIGNAIKFTNQGEVVVRVDLAGEPDASADERDWRVPLHIEVQDTGIGIPATEQARMFEAFRQADGSTTRQYGGTGLGLAISRRLIEGMGGSIGMDSEPGVGSTFWFRISLKPSTGLDASDVYADLSGYRVLVVDDNATNRTILMRQLDGWGMRCTAAATAREALDVLAMKARRGEPFALALLDVQMPEMDGIELAQRINDDAALAGVQRVILSSLGRTLTPEELERCGIVGQLTKPLRMSQLRRLITRILTSEASFAEAPPTPLAEVPSLVELPKDARRVLVVEDNPVNQRIVKRTLEKLGFRPDVAVNGKEALAAVRRNDYELVLMDCQMPVLDGYEATVEIRRREPDGRRLPIIAMTANAMEGDRDRCFAAGMDDYIAKPFRLADLESLLARWLDSEQGASETAS